MSGQNNNIEMKSKMSIVIEKMTEEDAQDVYLLGAAVEELRIDNNHTGYYSAGKIKLATKSEDEICLVARVNEEFAGFCLIHFNSVFKEAYFCDIAIKPNFRGVGIGNALYKKAEEILIDKGVDWTWAIVHEDNQRMMTFIEKQGYKKGRKFYVYHK